MRAFAAALLAALSLAAPARAQTPAPGHWAAAWAAAPQPRPANSSLPAAVQNQTVRQSVRVSLGGERLQVRLSNEFGRTPLRIGAASVSVGGVARRLTFSGHPAAVIPPGAPLVSDPVEVPVARMGEVTVNLFLPGRTELSTVHVLGQEPALISAPGDFTSQPTLPAATVVRQRLFLTGVSVWTREHTRVVAALGASVVDGYLSTPGAYADWPDLLATRLSRRPGPSVGVLNLGIAGNMLVGQGTGPSGVARLDRDVLSQPGLTHLILLEGRNDLGALPAGGADADAVFAAYLQIAERAHQHGVRVIAAPITPDATSGWDAAKEAERRRLNALIRSSRAFDGLVDMDAVLQDPAGPGLRPAYDSGDHLHPNDAGYRAMAEAVDLTLFAPD